MSKVYEITEDNATVFYCGQCREDVFRGSARNQASALCFHRQCTYCEEVKVVNVLSHAVTHLPVYLNEDGTPKVTYQEREGV